MEVLILGNGGAVSEGLPYNSFVIDGSALVEAPPDVMISLYRERVPVTALREVYLSHLHGDHCFGFPFLALEIFFRSVRDGVGGPCRVYAPAGGTEFLVELTRMALGGPHPCIDWMREHIEFAATSAPGPITLAGRETRLYRMEHFVETYGFTVHEAGRTPLAYSADTLWCPSLERMIAAGPGALLLDLNGEPTDPVPVHLSESELITKGLPIARPETVFVGTHLKHMKTPGHPRIRYASPGMTMTL
jgi:ribonuclease Z